jgi:hypothetical protein
MLVFFRGKFLQASKIFDEGEHLKLFLVFTLAKFAAKKQATTTRSLLASATLGDTSQTPMSCHPMLQNKRCRCRRQFIGHSR